MQQPYWRRAAAKPSSVCKTLCGHSHTASPWGKRACPPGLRHVTCNVHTARAGPRRWCIGGATRSGGGCTGRHLIALQVQAKASWQDLTGLEHVVVGGAADDPGVHVYVCVRACVVCMYVKSA